MSITDQSSKQWSLKTVVFILLLVCLLLLFQNEATSLHTICMDGHLSEDSIEVCHLLIDSGAKIDAPDIDGHTPLHFCCLNGLTDMAKVLVSDAPAISLEARRDGNS